jgi:hypothetical protein
MDGDAAMDVDDSATQKKTASTSWSTLWAEGVEAFVDGAAEEGSGPNIQKMALPGWWERWRTGKKDGEHGFDWEKWTEREGEEEVERDQIIADSVDVDRQGQLVLASWQRVFAHAWVEA